MAKANTSTFSRDITDINFVTYKCIILYSRVPQKDLQLLYNSAENLTKAFIGNMKQREVGPFQHSVTGSSIMIADHK